MSKFYPQCRKIFTNKNAYYKAECEHENDNVL